MPTVKFSKNDIAAGKPVSVDWYEAEIADYKFKTAKSGESNNHVFTFLIPSKGKRLVHYANDTYLEYLVPLVTALLGREPKEDEELDFALSKGKKLGIHVVNKLDDSGTMRQQVDQFRPAKVA